MKFYQLDSNELQKELETDLENGLDNSQVKKRMRMCGYNTQLSKPKLSLKSLNLPFLLICLIITVVFLVFAIFNKNLTYVFCSVVSLSLAVICQAMILTIKFILDKGIYMSSLNKPYTLTVLRDGVKCEVKYNEIVYGDVVFVEKGDYIPFDAVIISSNGLVTDESSVTGNDRVPKHPGVILKENLKASDLSNTVFCDSYVVHGKAKLVVTDVCSRVYISKSSKIKKSNGIMSSKTVDVSSLFLTIFSLFCIIFSIICGLISKDYIEIITSVLLFVALMISGIIKTSAVLIYKKVFLKLNKKGVFLKSYSDVDALNSTDILLLNSDSVFAKKAEIEGFISEELKYVPLSDIGKNNFSVFLYAAFSLDSKSIVLPSCIKILKKMGIDYNDFNSMCPTLASYYDATTGISVTAKAYEGKNMIIASGDYSIIKSMCTNSVPASEVEKLNFLSTEMRAVAIKIVDVIDDDLGVQLKDFTLVGVLGVNRKIEKNVSKKFEYLKNCGIKPIVLFSGNTQSAISTFSDSANCVSINDINNFSKNDFEKIDYLCDFSGSVDLLFDKLSSLGFYFAHIGDKSKHKRSTSIKVINDKPFYCKDADVVVSDGFKSIFSLFVEAKKSVYMVKSIFVNLSLFCAFYVVCGVLFSLLYKTVLINSLSIALVLLLVLPFSALILFYTDVSDRELLNDFKSSGFNGDNSLSYGIVTSILFLLLCTCLKFICGSETASAFMLVSFVTYLSFSVDYIRTKPVFSFLSILPSIFMLLILISPLSSLFSCSSFSFIVGLISVIVGAVLKGLAKFISRSVKI